MDGGGKPEPGADAKSPVVALAEQMHLSPCDEEDDTAGALAKQHGVKRHHHKHNLKHRYELLETLGKGTYGKVKRAIERFSGRVGMTMKQAKCS